MTPKEIDNFIMQCPYFGGKNIIDKKIIDGELVHIGECEVEWNHLKICPSAQCACAKKMGFRETCHDLKDYDELFVGNVRDGDRLTRCRDCKFLRFTGTVWKCQNRSVMMLCEPNDYCSRGERKEE